MLIIHERFRCGTSILWRRGKGRTAELDLSVVQRTMPPGPRMMRVPRACCALIFASCALSPAAATEWIPAPLKGGWIVTLGAEVGAHPDYEGNAGVIFRARPLFDVRRAGTARHFSSPRDGISVEILEAGDFRTGPTLKFRYPRRTTDDRDLRDIGRVGFAVEVGGFAEYWLTPWLRTRAEVRQGFGGHNGVVAELTSDVVYRASPQWTLSAGPRVTFASDGAIAPYFSITGAQSAASGLPVYNAPGGLRSYGAGVQTRYEWSAQWASHVFTEYDRLAGPVANSPLVIQRGSPNQFVSGVGLTYSFETTVFPANP